MRLHGTDSGYKGGCRDDCCRNAHADAANRYRDEHTKGLGRRVDTDTLIEQAIARGEKPSHILATFAIDYESYRGHLDRMSGCNEAAYDPLVCGTHAAYERHLACNEPIDRACEVGELAFKAERQQKSRGAKGRHMVGGRLFSSYFGPAPRAVIEELIDAISPISSRSRGAGGGGVAA